jgi:lysine 6-dehydrogenase
MNKPEILIIGAGLMGRAAAYFFQNHPEGPFRVMLVDRDERELDEAIPFLGDGSHAHVGHLDVTRSESLMRALSGVRICLSCVPYFLNPIIARSCLKLGVSFVDLGGNPKVTDEILDLDESARARGITLIPDTGFSPGLLNIVAWELVNRFKKCDEVRIWAGGLPQKPTGPLNYTQFFSIHGLVNEYYEDARELRDGKMVTVPSLSDLETVEFKGYGKFEAFVTSGGSSTLPRTLAGKVQNLSYKTMRYPGHMAVLESLRDLGLAEDKPYVFNDCCVSPRRMLVKVLEDKLPKQVPDLVLLRAIAKGDNGRTEMIEQVVKYNEVSKLTAMSQLVGFPSAAVVLAIYQGKIQAGAHTQETVISFPWMQSQLKHFGISLV